MSNLDPLLFSRKYLEHVMPLFKEYEGKSFQTAMDILISAYENGNTVFICGNGGSWGTGNHMVNDLSKMTMIEGKKRLRVIGLGDNVSLLTALANDCGYDTVFVEPLKSHWRPNDVVLCISASGRSPNVVNAAQYAKENGGRVISLVGFSGGPLKELGDAVLHFESENYGAIEDAQLMFSHLSSQFLNKYIREQ